MFLASGAFSFSHQLLTLLKQDTIFIKIRCYTGEWIFFLNKTWSGLQTLWKLWHARLSFLEALARAFRLCGSFGMRV